VIQRLTSQPSKQLNNWFFIILAVVAGAVTLTIASVLAPPLWIALVGVGALSALLWLISLQLGRDFELLFFVIFFIGYFQGFFITHRLGDSIPQSVWGLSKYGILALMVVGSVFCLATGKRITFSKPMLLWVSIWILNCVIFFFLILEAMNASALYNPILTIQVFGLGNMVFGMIVYLRVRPQAVQVALRLLVWAGIVATIWGVIQRLIGPSVLANLGFNVSGGLYFLVANTPETGFLDLTGGLRAFSFFFTHHAFSAFLILSVTALQILQTQGRVSRWAYLIAMMFIWAGIAVTFNLTNMLTALIVLVLFTLLEYSKRKSIVRAFSSKRLWRTAVSVAIFSAVIVSIIEPLRNRIVGAFDVRQGSATAGGSLAYRLEYFTAGFQALVDYPFGFGLRLSSMEEDYVENFRQYARVNGYFQAKQLFFSGDNWFQWLAVQIGIFNFILYSLLYIIPIYVGWKQRKRIRSPEFSVLSNGLFALATATFIAGISNSPILAFPPSNLLIWAASGLILKIAEWDREAIRQNASKELISINK
jgi:hypothetical protein